MAYLGNPNPRMAGGLGGLLGNSLAQPPASAGGGGLFGTGFGAPSGGGWNPDILTAIGLGLMSGATPSQSFAGIGQYLPDAIKTGHDRIRQQALQKYFDDNQQALGPGVAGLLKADPALIDDWAKTQFQQKPQGMINAGNGVIYDPVSHTFIHDPNANATTLYGNAPSGYRFKKDGGLEPISGGPADPNTVNMLSPEALDLVSTQYLAGDKSSITGFARNPTMRAQLTNAIAKKAAAMGMDGKAVAAEISAYGGNVAAQRSAGTRAAQVGMAASEANQMADIALEASKSVPRESFVPWNQAVNAWRTGTSSPDMAAFVTATTSLVNAYARAVSPLGAPTDAMRQHAEEMLNTAQGPDAYAAVIAQMKKEMEAALNAPSEISGRLKSDVSGQGQDVPPQAPVVGGDIAAPTVIDGYTIRQVK